MEVSGSGQDAASLLSTAKQPIMVELKRRAGDNASANGTIHNSVANGALHQNSSQNYTLGKLSKSRFTYISINFLRNVIFNSKL